MLTPKHSKPNLKIETSHLIKKNMKGMLASMDSEISAIDDTTDLGDDGLFRPDSPSSSAIPNNTKHLKNKILVSNTSGSPSSSPSSFPSQPTSPSSSTTIASSPPITILEEKEEEKSANDYLMEFDDFFSRPNRNRSNAHRFEPVHLKRGLNRKTLIISNSSSLSASISDAANTSIGTVVNKEEEEAALEEEKAFVKSDVIYMFEIVRENAKKINLNIDNEQNKDRNVLLDELLNQSRYSFCVSSKSSDEVCGQHLLPNVEDFSTVRVQLKKEYSDTLDISKFHSVFSQYETSFFVSGRLSIF